jgi:hypothetical protein
MWFHSSDDNVAPRVVVRKIAASQGVFIPGAPVYISAGYATLCAVSAGSDAWHGFVVGCANAQTIWPLEAELAAGTEVLVALIEPKHLYGVYVANGGTAVQGGTDAAIAQTNIGLSYGLNVVTSTPSGYIGYVNMDLGNTSDVVIVENTMFNIEPLKNAAADSPGIAIVRFIPSVISATK